MKIYLSGPMRGVPDLNRPAFAMYANLLRTQGHTVMNPAATNMEGRPIRDIFAYDLNWLCLQADVVAMMPGWEGSRGAIAELATARAVGLEVMWLDQMADAAI